MDEGKKLQLESMVSGWRNSTQQGILGKKKGFAFLNVVEIDGRVELGYDSAAFEDVVARGIKKVNEYLKSQIDSDKNLISNIQKQSADCITFEAPEVFQAFLNKEFFQDSVSMVTYESPAALYQNISRDMKTIPESKTYVEPDSEYFVLIKDVGEPMTSVYDADNDSTHAADYVYLPEEVFKERIENVLDYHRRGNKVGDLRFDGHCVSFTAIGDVCNLVREALPSPRYEVIAYEDPSLRDAEMESHGGYDWSEIDINMSLTPDA